MSKVYIQAFTEENVTKWGLFFEDKWGKTKHLDEDFKHLAVDLINRSTIDNLEYRDGVYYYKGNV